MLRLPNNTNHNANNIFHSHSQANDEDQNSSSSYTGSSFNRNHSIEEHKVVESDDTIKSREITVNFDDCYESINTLNN
jgi:hypothetical protein